MIKQSVESTMFRIEAGDVTRVHTLPHHGRYPVNGHTFNMLQMLRVFFPEHYNIKTVSVVLDHDVPEKVVGDTPWAAKYPLSDGKIGEMLHEAEQPVVDEFFLATDDLLSSDEKDVVSFLDRLEFFIWAVRQVGMGNRLLVRKVEECRNVLKSSKIYADAPLVWDDTFEAFEEYTIAESTDWWQRVVKNSGNNGVR